MIDENAYGCLLSYYCIEEDEYALEAEDFVQKFQAFRETALTLAEERPLAEVVRVLTFGHAVYFEVAEGDEQEDPLGWLKAVRASLQEQTVGAVGVLSHGSRWVVEGDSEPSTVWARRGPLLVQEVSPPSEPLRRVLYADAACRSTEDGSSPGWGGGLYVDVEAVEATGRELKNAPTPLLAAEASFYRVAR